VRSALARSSLLSLFLFPHTNSLGKMRSEQSDPPLGLVFATILGGMVSVVCYRT